MYSEVIITYFFREIKIVVTDVREREGGSAKLEEKRNFTKKERGAKESHEKKKQLQKLVNSPSLLNEHAINMSILLTDFLCTNVTQLPSISSYHCVQRQTEASPLFL